MRKLAISFLLCAWALCAERVTVPLRDPSRPPTIRVSALNTSVHVKAHASREVIVDTDGNRPSTRPGPNGMRQIMIGMTGFSVEEDNNIVTIKPGMHSSSPLVVYVPVQSSVQLKITNGSELRVEGVEGEINAEATNGSVVLVDVGGPVVAHSLNGRVTAVLKSVPAGKPMSFSTLNGRVDVTLPASAKADLKINNSRGSTYSDFDMQLTAEVKRSESGRDQGPKYKLNLEHSVVGKINGGGPEYSFRSLNGNIYIRKGS